MRAGAALLLVFACRSFAATPDFLDDLSQRSFRFFWEQTDAGTGLVRDRARADGSAELARNRNIASSASTGFGLTAICVAAKRHWVGQEEARQRVRTTLEFFAGKAVQEHGWFYHWMDPATGDRQWKSEISSIDTALLLAGILTARQCFHDDADIVRLATRIYERVDFPWMLDGDPGLLSHGWKPESGFLKSRWNKYSEHMILYLLAIGSPTHPIDPRSWYAWRRDLITYNGYRYVSGGGPLFLYQYSQAWVDFRNRPERDGAGVDWFENSVIATRAHRAFCLDLRREFPLSYREDLWGITASDSATGYRAWGGPPRDPKIDGTVVPCAAGGSLMLTPDLARAALENMRQQFGDRIYNRYGFVDAFNPTTGWTDTDVIGIDEGITLVSAANLRDESVWKWFMKNPEIPRALDLAGMRTGTAKK